MNGKNNFIAPVTILTLGMIVCTLIFAFLLTDRAKANQTITVTGSAKREITSDLGILRGYLQTSAPTAEAAYQELLKQRPAVLGYLRQQGFREETINLTTINLNPVHEMNNQGFQTNRVLYYNANQSVEVTAYDVELIKRVSLDITSLVEQGISFSVNPPEFYYTKLADLKIDIQADAARDALNRAQKIAEATGSKLGPISSARMGVLQITPVNSNMVSDYGINDVTSIEKEITAVVNASFRLD